MNDQRRPARARPTHLSAYADICLQALAAAGLGSTISLGGATGLLYYLDYRPTHTWFTRELLNVGLD